MSRNKKVIFGVAFVLFLIVLWVSVYFICLQIKPKGDNVVTAKELAELDDKDTTLYDGTIIVEDKEYALKDLSKSELGDTVVVKVKLDDKELKGYITYSDVVTKPEIKLFDNGAYAKVILKDDTDTK